MAERKPGNGLGRALLLGLLAGAIILGLLVGAYAIGRDQGSDGAGSTGTTSAPTTAPTTPATTPAPSPPAATGPELIAAGQELYTASGCSGCHSLDGSPGVGPTLKGIAGSQVTLEGGQEVTADAAYLTEAIREPDARVVEGYPAGAMPDLGLSDEDIAALVAFLRSQ